MLGPAGQLGDERSERVGDVGAEDEVGDAGLLASAAQLVGGCRRGRAGGRRGNRLLAALAVSVFGGAMNGETVSPTTGMCIESSTSRLV